MNNLSLGLVRSIHDPIHGSIKLSNEEIKIIEHPLFKRLHHIRQNSFLYKVFPSAKHTRFEHSIGVMHLASKMLIAILENGEIANQRNDIVKNIQDELLTNIGVGINIYEHLKKDKVILRTVFKQLRFAALLHDIGHGPLSHLFDSFAPTVEEFHRILLSDPELSEDTDISLAIINMIKEFESSEIRKGKKPAQIRVEHEHISSYFTYVVLKEIGITIDNIKNVLTILKPTLNLGKLILTINETDFDLLKLLNDIVASAPIDCDRMDYLKRDSYFVGVPYGNYSEDRILKSLLSYVNNSNEVRLGIKLSGLHAIENFVQARYELYVQVYGHKTNEACQAILNFVCQEKLPFSWWSNISLDQNKTLAMDFIQLYISLTDEIFLEKVITAAKENAKQLQYGKKIATALEKLQSRDLWKRVYETEEFIASKNEETMVSKIFDEEFKKMKDGPYRETYKFYGVRFPLKDFEDGAKLLEKTSKSYYVVSDKELNKASQIIESLNKGLRVLRIYSIKADQTPGLKRYVKENFEEKIRNLKNHTI
ncbi:HD domain-containing protein [Priestia megaterium]|uniref:HD domain-containing protein n=1 Tax=Priestia megaterium TaxID=1404 RepID=UPI002447C5B0|nr:HD domain-containing protein [Priestia megaterium]MDH2363776.1 HD domain-containing protein [Priestia megaterium]